MAGSVLAEFENTALYALRDFASSGGTAKEVWYGSSGLSSAHPVGLMGGYLQVCDNLRCARNVQASTQERCSCTRFNGVCPLEKKKASLSPRAPISVEVLPVVVASSPASPVCGLWGCVPFCCCYQPFSRLRWWFEDRLLGEVGVVSRCTPRTKENTTEPVGLSRRSRYSPRKDAGQGAVGNVPKVQGGCRWGSLHTKVPHSSVELEGRKLHGVGALQWRRKRP